MKKSILIISLLLSACLPSNAEIKVNPSNVIGPIKPMNAVNNGPVFSNASQIRDNFDAYKALNIPFARIHDANSSDYFGGPHIVDITAVFPDFSKNVNSPESYDFLLTDKYLKNIQDAGAEVFFRLGQTIEHQEKKYGIYPPADYKKWAQICEHIIRHYTEGWANGYQWKIRYWEIWNEPDLDADDNRWKEDPRTWGGSKEEFFKFYEIAAKHLKKCFPHLKIGGPATAGSENHKGNSWTEEFLQYLQGHNVALDFFSWHVYTPFVEKIENEARLTRETLDKYGFTETESILNEWNCVGNWMEGYQHYVSVMNSIKGAAFTASALLAGQNSSIDMLMYYDARYPSVFCGLFDFYTFNPTEVYYALYGWDKLTKLGTQIEATVDEKDMRVVAATDGKSKTCIYISRYNDDCNVYGKKEVKINVKNVKFEEMTAHLTDSCHLFTEVPVTTEDGVISINLEPDSFIIIELR